MSVPSGWKPSTLGQLGNYLNGRGFKKSEWSPSGRPIIRIQNLTGSSSEFNYFAGEAAERHTVHAGDLLVSWAATLGAYFWNGPEAVVNQHIFKVESFIEPKFHKYLLDYKLDELMHETHGSGMVHITRPKFDALPVAIPSGEEQRRIVELVEEHLSHLDAADAALSAVRTRLEQLRMSSMTAALNAARAMGVRESSVGAEAVLIEYGSSSKTGEPSSPDDVPVIRMGNIQRGNLDWANLKFLPVGHPDVQRYALQPGDLLFNRTNSAELVGKSAVYEGASPRALFASYLIRVRLNGEVLPAWANIAINSSAGRAYIASVVSQQVGQANVNSKKLRSFPLPVPSIDQQRGLLARFEDTVDGLHHLEAQNDQAEQRSAALRRAVLAAAFSGRLTGHASDADVIEETAATLPSPTQSAESQEPLL